MKNLVLTLLFTLFFLKNQAQTSGNVSVSLTFSSVARISIASSGSSTLTLGSPSTAGSSITTTVSDETKWLNFTSAVANGVSRRIEASVSAGTVPSGLQLRVGLNAAVGGGGTLGTLVATVASPVTLGTAATVLNNITGAYTGVGVGNGFKLTYTVNVSNYGLLRSGTNVVQITYTLIDN
ncbi:hypothetical protein [Emticicia sp. W12TSBA100-4]|uniref:hypothetical protein n=1 Tax=Emticicia sp. W12TSBA100-4 TaxID=3160965 RepID=UPI003306077F